ncbi:putative Peptidyl-Lys metalloendopeptidase [Mycena indigotica]|uniref:Putative Peptidyl-Lys metalloendopeptidase n=1 Tax=Mycena indigotica TaxID=2126181 RepID=A0A8H6SPD9_9AGAR|nr:putative Peptidyl-Lys metalloendopeptidase [Mycena indigotica]KAF7303560.1 putative Peptidyl-Lys metalloendopeptidase [Mycena indigotica]
MEPHPTLDAPDNPLHLIVSLMNTGDVALKLLRDPHTVLDPFPAQKFAITSTTGRPPAFIGGTGKYVPEAVVRANKDDAFLLFPPGSYVNIKYDLTIAYNFSDAGDGPYTVYPANLFQHLNADGALVTIAANITHASHRIRLSGPPTVTPPPPPGTCPAPQSQTRSRLQKRINFHCCTFTQQAQLADAAAAAQILADAAHMYLLDMLAHQLQPSATPRYRAWFGPFSPAHHGLILTHFRNLAEHKFTSFTYDCTCRHPTMSAYVHGMSPAHYGIIYICPAFWYSNLVGTDSQAGTLIHESSHFAAVAGTHDVTLGQNASLELALRDPRLAIMNADNHEYFAENRNPELP